MKKTLLAIALTTSVGAVNAVTAPMTSATFTMLDGTNGTVGVDTTVTGSIGDGAWAVASTTPFFGVVWNAHGGTTFGPGTYSFDTIEGGVYTGVVVGAGQVGGHILFNWGATADIDVVNVWDVADGSIGDPATILKTYTSTDVTASAGTGANTPIVAPDGILGLSMIDGAFVGFNANFDFSFEASDDTPPVITLLGDNPQSVVVNTAYVELGADCIDAAPQQTQPTFMTIDDSAVDISAIGNTFDITYECTDTNVNGPTQVVRTVNVVDENAVTTLLGTTPVDHECKDTVDTYVDAGAQCADPQDGTWTSFDGIPPAPPIPAGLVLTGVPFDEKTPGVAHDLIWTCTDTDLNTGTATRVVNVVDTLSPVPGLFTINDSVSVLETPTGPLYFETNDAAGYVDPTLEAVTDECDLTVPSLANMSGTVTTTLPDGVNVLPSTLTYTATDLTGNVMSTPLEVQLRRSEPVITLLGDSQVILDVGDTYVEPGMDVHDEQDGDLTAVTTSGTTTGVGAGAGDLIHNIVIRDAFSTIVASIDTSINGGRYTISYDVTDSDTNPATQVIRNVNVGAFAVGSNFTMLQLKGDTFGGTNDVVFDWDETLNTAASDTNFNMEISSAGPTPFNGAVWIAHDIRTFGPGTYYFETDNSVCTVAVLQATGCPGTAGSPTSMEMVVGAGQVGAHILFDWNGVLNIDVVNVYDKNAVWDDFGDAAPRNSLFLGPGGSPPDATQPWELVSTSQFSDNIGPVHGSPMIDGPFIGFYANFNAGPGGVGEALPPITTEAPDTSLGASSMSVWAMLAGLFSLLGLRIANRKMAM